MSTPGPGHDAEIDGRATATADAAPPEQQPILRVVGGRATAADLAAIVAVVTATTAATAPPSATHEARSRWAAPAARLRRPLPLPGAGAWASVADPR